jgi:putative nucleotidyltransferase with HDIG domain
VVVTGCLAALACFVVAVADPTVETSAILLAGTLAALGLGSELLSFNQTKQSAGSVALIPFAGAVLVAPHSTTLLLVLGAELLAQAVQKRPWLKLGFNLAQVTLGLAIGILAYRALGGREFAVVANKSFISTLTASVLPASGLVLSVLVINALCVSAVISVTSGKRLVEVWASHTRATIPYFVITVLVSIYLTWLSVHLGAFGTAGMAIPLIAVRQLYRTTLELTTVTEELLDLMVAAIEARDPYTSGHSQRVARASEVIARSIGLSSRETERVTVAALLHDVGKIDERFAPILAKEGRLTPEEWQIMKEHPVRGAALVGLLSSLQDIVKPVRHHHENWDGTGYPDGIAREAIPLASRIIMFADTLDAMTTDRPYRKALSLTEARAEFLKFRGRQFDPSICDRILTPAVWEELYNVLDKSQAAIPSPPTVRRSRAS